MRPGFLLGVLRERWLGILALAMTGLLVGAAPTALGTPRYRASTTLFLALTRADTVSELNQGVAYVQNLTKSYSRVVTTPEVLDPVIAQLRLQTTSTRLARTLKVTATPGTVLVTISATGRTAQQATAVANAVGGQLTKTVPVLATTGPRVTKPLTATTVAVATLPTSPQAPLPRRDIPAGLGLGLLVGIALAILRDVNVGRVRSESDLREALGLPVLAIIGRHRKQALLDDSARGPDAEAYRFLRTSVLAAEDPTAGRSVVLSSATRGEGASTTAVNLAVALAVAGVRVVLVDADLRRPQITDMLALTDSDGLSGLLQGKAALDDVLLSWGQCGLHIVPAGPIPADPSERLGSASMVVLLAELCNRYDVVVLDTPAVLSYTDAAVLGRLTDGTVVVVDASSARRRTLRRSLEVLDLGGAAPLGAVLNKSRPVDVRAVAGAPPPSATPPAGSPEPADSGQQSRTVGA